MIFDDDSDMIKSQLPFFIQTSFEDGLLPKHAIRAIEILNHEPNAKSSEETHGEVQPTKD